MALSQTCPPPTACQALVALKPQGCDLWQGGWGAALAGLGLGLHFRSVLPGRVLFSCGETGGPSRPEPGSLAVGGGEVLLLARVTLDPTATLKGPTVHASEGPWCAEPPCQVTGNPTEGRRGWEGLWLASPGLLCTSRQISKASCEVLRPVNERSCL